jgi:hypothetical protein
MKMDARNPMFVLNRKEITMETCAQPIVLGIVTITKYYAKDTLMKEDVAHLTHVPREELKRKETTLEVSVLVIVLQTVNTMKYYALAKKIVMVA